MSDLIRIVAVVAIVGFVIGRQLQGEALRGKRVVMLPLVLAIIGIVDLAGSHAKAGTADVICLLVGGVVSAAIGVAQGRSMRLESRNGSLWGQLPARSLWLWLALIGSRVAMTLIADSVHARLAASGATILLMLGINRLAQAGVVVPRAMAAGIAFAPEKDGSTFLSGLMTPQVHGSVNQVAATIGQLLVDRRHRHHRVT